MQRMFKCGDSGDAENAGPENLGPENVWGTKNAVLEDAGLKMLDRKMQDLEYK